MRCPILFLHAEDDHLVPIQVAQQVLQAQRHFSCDYEGITERVFSLGFPLPDVRGGSERPECRASAAGVVLRLSGVSAQRLIPGPPPARHHQVGNISLICSEWSHSSLADCIDFTSTACVCRRVSSAGSWCCPYEAGEATEGGTTCNTLHLDVSLGLDDCMNVWFTLNINIFYESKIFVCRTIHDSFGAPRNRMTPVPYGCNLSSVCLYSPLFQKKKKSFENQCKRCSGELIVKWLLFVIYILNYQNKK